MVRFTDSNFNTENPQSEKLFYMNIPSELNIPGRYCLVINNACYLEIRKPFRWKWFLRVWILSDKVLLGSVSQKNAAIFFSSNRISRTIEFFSKRNVAFGNVTPENFLVMIFEKAFVFVRMCDYFFKRYWFATYVSSSGENFIPFKPILRVVCQQWVIYFSQYF